MSQQEFAIDYPPPGQDPEELFTDAQPSLAAEEPETGDAPEPKAKNARLQPNRRREFSPGFAAKLEKLFEIKPFRKFLVDFGWKRNSAVARIDYSALGYEEIMEFQSGCSELALADKTVKSLHYEDNVATFEAGLNKRWNC